MLSSSRMSAVKQTLPEGRMTQLAKGAFYVIPYSLRSLSLRSYVTLIRSFGLNPARVDHAARTEIKASSSAWSSDENADGVFFANPTLTGASSRFIDPLLNAVSLNEYVDSVAFA